MNILATARAPALDPAEHHVLLRLRAGASPWPWWNFTAKDRGLQIVIGSDPHCDWQIASAGVEEQELEVFFTGHALLVRSMRPGRGARLNGVKLGEGWAPVADGARLDIGLASIEVSIRELNSPGAVPPSARPTLLQQPEWPNLESSVRSRAAQVDDWERANYQEAEARRAEDEDAEGGEVPATPTPSDVWSAENTSESTSEARRVPSDVSAPHLFDDSLGVQPVLVRYAAYVAGLGIAYAIWVMLLDQI